MTLLPAGRIDLTDRARPLHEMVGDQWPDGLWICAVRRTDGARVVFGREGSPRAPLAAAVLASCAIPAYFAPVTIGGVEYFDGGVHSPTNADVLRRRPPDLVVVVSPMSAPRPLLGAADSLLRWSAHRRLEREARRLERAGSVVVRIEPGASSPRRHGPYGRWTMTGRIGWPRRATGRRRAWWPRVTSPAVSVREAGSFRRV